MDNSGVYQQYDGGVLIYRNGGPVYFVWGKIRDAWNANQASQGKLGYPTADETTEPDGSYKSTFEHGTITWKPGDAEATVTVELVAPRIHLGRPGNPRDCPAFSLLEVPGPCRIRRPS